MGAINKSYVPDKAYRKVEEKSMEAFKMMMKRNPNSQERERISNSVREQARRLNEGR